jgi:mRNA interferase MazF
MRRGDVILVNFPFTDQTGSKVRPALVVMADSYNRKLAQTIVALISGSKNRKVGDPSQLVVDPTTPEGASSGLRSVSVVLCETLLTMQQKRSLGAIGHFSAPLMAKVDDCLRSVLDV